MSDILQRVENEAMALSVRERAYLANRLLESLDESATEDPAEVERAWAEEIERRVSAYRQGSARTLPADQVLADARARLRKR